MLVKNLMSTPVFSLKENDSLHSARSLMSLQRIRHIPIITVDNQFVGLLTHRDILSVTTSKLAELDSKTQKEIDSGIPIREIMQTNIVTVEENTTVKKAAQLLLNHKYGCLPVLANDKLCGIITEADFLRLAITMMDALNDKN